MACDYTLIMLVAATMDEFAHPGSHLRGRYLETLCAHPLCDRKLAEIWMRLYADGEISTLVDSLERLHADLVRYDPTERHLP